ncbi:MAG TPA: hypothetical protein VK761_01955 [Solirubrobacteraceae bacterium]|jgi:hypothetical protein|nr:hypothetical protein [Solirubrobacteraceae bacterium]
MLALLLAVALIGLTVLSLLLAGALVATATAIAVLNLGLVAFGLRARRPSKQPQPTDERWRPSAFRLPPEPPVESDDATRVTVHRR